MILRRVIEHVKAQNWTAVALDFVIVVVGVFIGIQVSNWNAARQAAADEHATLSRLQEESERAVAYWRYEAETAQSFNENRRVLLAVLDAGYMSPAQRTAVDDAFRRLGHYGTFNPPRAVLDELIEAGGLSRISDLNVRGAVSAYDTELDYVNGQLSYFRQNLPQIVNAYNSSVFSVYAPDTPSLRRYEYDVRALAADRQFVSDMVDAVRDQLQFGVYRQNILTKTIAMCEALSEATDTQCAPVPFGQDEAARREGVNQ